MKHIVLAKKGYHVYVRNEYICTCKSLLFCIQTRKHQFILLILSTQGLQIPSEVIRGKRLKNRSKIATFCKIWYIRKWRKNYQIKPVISTLPANLSGNSSLAKLEDETEAKTMQIWKKLFMVWQKIFFGDSLIHDEVLCFLPYCSPSLAWCQCATAEALRTLSWSRPFKGLSCSVWLVI